ncbi:MAG TPA: 4-alpha-glucanotransferase [Terriglobales bacterium]|nr:4-alpha-glucanotransferase [Terriglobales bacterium]
MVFERSSGVVLHPTSLPSRGGIGDFGPAAYAFADFLQQSGQTLWQILPLSPVGFGHSPYSATSAFAGNPLLISIERLAEKGWVSKADAAALAPPSAKVDFEKVFQKKLPLLKQAAAAFLAEDQDSDHYQQFQKFCDDNAWWLEDFVLFSVLRDEHRTGSWNQWPREIASRTPEALEGVRKQHATALQVERTLQFLFYSQWNDLRRYCAEKKIRIIGDVAIFVNFDSADVWAHPHLFRLNADLQPEVVSGVPPDAFSATGQRWGNPLYRWDVLRNEGYGWWIQRMRWAVTVCDYVRLDHFRGFDQCWEINADEPTAVNGRWVDGPRDDLFQVLHRELGDLPFIAEDLGMITHQVIEMRDRLSIPGMKVLQFAFGDRGAHVYLPHIFDHKCVVYTGTHDNDTTAGWFQALDEGVRAQVLAYTGEPKDGVHWGLIRAASASQATFAIFPLQDFLGLGNEARMNVPSIANGNWGWRYMPNALKPELAKKLAVLADVTDRLPG